MDNSISFEKGGNFYSPEWPFSLSRFSYKAFQFFNLGASLYNNIGIVSIIEALKKVQEGKIKRLIINIPPRNMKSLITSTAFPAWMLGVRPHTKMICVSYSQTLANKFSLETKSLMSSQWYQSVFEDTHIMHGANTKSKFMTTDNGFRFAVGTGGSITGEGADIIIIDDPHKPKDALNIKAREKVIDWYQNTLSSRLNNKQEGAIILVMQRLHDYDLSGYLENYSSEDWHILKLPCYNSQNSIIQTRSGIVSPKSAILSPIDSIQTIARMRSEMGEKSFMAQYQQSPKYDESFSIVKPSWIIQKELLGNFDQTFISLDSAVKDKEINDMSVFTIWKVKNHTDKNKNILYIVDCIPKRVLFPDLLKIANEMIHQYKPNGFIIEDKGSGSSLIQELKDKNHIGIKPISPKESKAVRFSSASIYFENKQVTINPNIKEIDYIINQLTSFPNVKHDDVCDSVSLFLNWYHSYYHSNTGFNIRRL